MKERIYYKPGEYFVPHLLALLDLLGTLGVALLQLLGTLGVATLQLLGTPGVVLLGSLKQEVQLSRLEGEPLDIPELSEPLQSLDSLLQQGVLMGWWTAPGSRKGCRGPS